MRIPVVARREPTERRREDRWVHVDRRKSYVDVIEHLIRGVRRDDLRDSSDDRPTRRRRGK